MRPEFISEKAHKFLKALEAIAAACFAMATEDEWREGKGYLKIPLPYSMEDHLGDNPGGDFNFSPFATFNQLLPSGVELGFLNWELEPYVTYNTPILLIKQDAKLEFSCEPDKFGPREMYLRKLLDLMLAIWDGEERVEVYAHDNLSLSKKWSACGSLPLRTRVLPEEFPDVIDVVSTPLIAFGECGVYFGTNWGRKRGRIGDRKLLEQFMLMINTKLQEAKPVEVLISQEFMSGNRDRQQIFDRCGLKRTGEVVLGKRRDHRKFDGYTWG